MLAQHLLHPALVCLFISTFSCHIAFSSTSKSTEDIIVPLNESLNVTSPGYPGNYTTNFHLTWLIKVSEGQSVFLRFSHFDLEPGYDYVKIGFGNVSGLEETRLITVSGNTLPSDINTRHRTAWVEFVSDSAIGFSGFSLEIFGKAEVVDFFPHDIQAQPEGLLLLESPNYPDTYPANTLVSYVIEAPEDHYILARVLTLNTERGSDILYIGEGMEVGRRETVRETLTGNKKYITAYHESESRWMWILFVSDYFYGLTGYTIQVSFVTADYRLALGEPMLFQPIIQYQSTWRFFLSSNWTFEGPKDSVFRVHFLDLNLHVGLEFFVAGIGLDFFDLEAWRFGIGGDEEPLDMITDSNRMTILIASYTDTVNGSILVEVTAIPKPENIAPVSISAEGTVILTSPHYPHFYPNNYQQVWHVEAPEGYVIHNRLLDFDMPYDNDGISVGNGLFYYQGGSVIGGWSGRVSSPDYLPTFTSDTNAMYVFFATDPSDSGRGFKMELTAITTPIILQEYDVYTLISPYYPMPYENDVFIQWHITAPTGFGVLIHFIKFDLIDQGDVLVVGEGTRPNDTDSILHEFTGISVPSDFTVWSGRAWVRFTTNEDGIADGFKLELRTALGDGHCVIPLGLEGNWIEDTSLTATSQKDNQHGPNQARLHGPSSWIPDPDKSNSMLQVSFGQSSYVTGLLIQGGPESQGTWLTSLIVAFDDGTEISRQKGWNPREISKVLFSRPRLTEYVRIQPISKTSELLSLRLDVLGCINDCHFDLGISSGHLRASNIRVPNHLNRSGIGNDDVRMKPFVHYPLNEWVTQSIQNNETFIEVTFEESVIVRDIIIQQCNGSRIKLFRAEVYRNDVSTSSNFDISECLASACKVSTQWTVSANKYKIFPTTWDGDLCLRLELLGCTSVECAISYCGENCSSASLSKSARESSIDLIRLLPPRALCQSNITLRNDAYISFIFRGFDGVKDIKGISDGDLKLDDPEAQSKTTFDLTHVPPVLISASSQLNLKIASGLLTAPANITASFGFVDSPGCFGEETDNVLSCTESSGIFFSPNYFNPYPPNIDQTWEISTKPWTQIILRFIEFDVASLDESCQEDFVVITDVSTLASLGRFCSRNPAIGLYMSSLNRMRLYFHSDAIESASGFLAEYNTGKLIPDVLSASTTDNHTCPRGWDNFRRSCYKLFISSDVITWNEAEAECRTVEGAHLISIHDKDEMTMLHYMISTQWETAKTKTYIGLGNRNQQGVFVWTDGTPMSYTDWYIPSNTEEGEKQPNGGLLEACAMLIFDQATSTDLSTDLWHDVACASPETTQFVCKTQSTGSSWNSSVHLSKSDSVEECDPGLFKCTSGECIRDVYVCDDVIDCHDQSDEDGCNEACDENQFQCNDESCISVSFVCDNVPHCEDNSDEIDCVYPACTEFEFTCANGQCIDIRKRCDFVPHCYDSSDELDCVLELSSSVFQCFDGSLFPNKVRCDGMIDCIGKTIEDEDHCDYIKPNFACNSDTELRCDNGACAPLDSVCMHELDEFGLPNSCRDVTNLKECESHLCPAWTLKCPDTYCIPLRYRCDGKMDCPAGEDEHECDTYYCPSGSYHCHGNTICISPDHVCDDVIHCPDQDDETFCANCPEGCTCAGLSYTCHAESINVTSLPRNLRKLSLGCENETTCASIDVVVVLETGGNESKTIVPSMLPYLTELDLENAGVSEIEVGSFSKSSNILHLDLALNDIEVLFHDTLGGLQRLLTLNLSSNPLQIIEMGTFDSLSNLQELDIRNTLLAESGDTGVGMFTGLQNLQTLYADKYLLCCLAGLGDSPNCNAPRDQFSSCEDLMANNILRIFIWILGTSAFIGNVLVVGYRLVNSGWGRHTTVQSSLITNLAVSDFLMGLYMITIASADVYYQGNYAAHADDWQNSVLCKLAGITSVVSSEASVFLIMVISIDRCVHVVAPFKPQLHLSVRSARVAEFVTWSIAAFLGILPTLIPAFVEGKFYGQSGVCLALPLTVDRPAGWHYSISLFIGVNFVAFLVTLMCYISIYCTFQMSKQQIVGKRNKSKEEMRLAENLKLASKMALVVGTDLVCWLPIIIMGLMSASGTLTISAQVYAWTAVFVLPVNSSLNPYLYTLASVRQRKQKSAESRSMKYEEKTMEASIFDETSIISAFSSLPDPSPERLVAWMDRNPRALGRFELDVIQRDVTKAVEKMKESGHWNDVILNLHRIAVQTDDTGRIIHAFVVLDSSLAFLESRDRDQTTSFKTDENIDIILNLIAQANMRK